MGKLFEIHEVSEIAGVSVRTLQYYDSINLLKPSSYTDAGYRLYDEESLGKLQQILFFKELEFPLKEIKEIIGSDNFDRNKALEQQIELLTLKKKRLEDLILFAKKVKELGGTVFEFDAFSTDKIDEYSKRAKEQWGDTAQFKEYEIKAEKWNDKDKKNITIDFMGLFVEFGNLKTAAPESDDVQLLVRNLQDYITEHFYKCTKDILRGLGKMYSAGGEFTENIDKMGGKGTAEFTSRAIEIYCNK